MVIPQYISGRPIRIHGLTRDKRGMPGHGNDPAATNRRHTVKVTATEIWNSLMKLRHKAPLVHNITNYVVNTANALLALGASPVMAHAREEVEEMVDIADALVLNIGTLSEHWVDAMFMAAQRAGKRGIPVIFDPVGAGATTYRTETSRRLIRSFSPSIIRGNASEILALGQEEVRTKGVDSTDPSANAIECARSLNSTLGSVICVSGATDYIINGNDMALIRNGHPMMQRVTGLGCTASALCGAFAAVEDDKGAAAAHAMALMGIAGEMAAEKAEGPAGLQSRLIDIFYSVTESDIGTRLSQDD